MTSPVPHQAIYRRWRAQTFGEIVGQEAVVETLRNAVRTERVSHAVLFVGPRGTGKTSLARILAKALNCTNLQDGDACDRCPSCVAIREGTTLDLVEIDAASNRGIDAVRDLRERLPYPPGELRRKVYILDEAHQITKDAWNALLKSLEEPPEFVNFMFASTEPSGFPPAILSRLQRFDVRRLTTTEIEGKLARILDADGRAADPAALHLIATLAAGGMRDAESMLDQLLASAPDTIDEARVRDLLGLADAEAVDAFVAALVDGDAAAGIALLDALEERGRDARTLLDQTVEAIRARLVASLGSGGGSVPPGLTDAARRLAAIDPDRAGVGGLRLQLELALFRDPIGQAVPGGRARPVAVRCRRRARACPARQTRLGARCPGDAPAAPATTPAARRRLPGDTAGGQGPSRQRAASARPPRNPRPRPRRPRRPRHPTAPPLPPAAGRTGTANATPVDAVPVMVSTPSDVDLDRLQDHWSEVVASVGPATRAVITECRPMAVDANIVTLGFPESRGFLKDQAERKRVEIEGALSQVVGREVGVRMVATNVEIPGPLTAADVRAAFGDLVVDVG